MLRQYTSEAEQLRERPDYHHRVAEQWRASASTSSSDCIFHGPHQPRIPYELPKPQVGKIICRELRATEMGETTLRLARYFGTSAEFWLGMQKDYDLQVARDEFEAQVDKQVRPRDQAA
jgi:hypothetical protein